MRIIQYFMSRKSMLLILFDILLIVFFFSPLYYPHISIFATPDFGRSDIWQLNLPAKYFLSQSLKQGELPLWNNLIGNGFPSLAEGQIGTFNITNLVLYKFLPFYVAWNTSFIVIFLTAAIGTFLYARVLNLSRISSFMASFLFTFSGVFITHITHNNLIQTASYLPWIFWAAHHLVKRPSPFWIGITAFLLSQQIFSGFPQVALITLISIMILIAGNQIQGKKQSLGILAFICAIILGFAITSIQLLPQNELLSISNRSAGLSLSNILYFSFPPRQFLGFIYPYIFGDPRTGTFPPFTKASGTIFWEVTGYIGILPLIFVLLALLRRNRRPLIRSYALLLATTALLMTGKYSPLYFVFAFFPLRFFRVPARFLLPFVWSMVILAGFGFDELLRILNVRFRYWFASGILIIVMLLDIFMFSFTYNPRISLTSWNDKPKILETIKRNNVTRIYTIGSFIPWNKIFLRHGWESINQYLFLRNDLSPNLNVLYNQSSFGVYPILATKRYEHVREIIDKGVSVNIQAQEATLSANTIKLLKIYGISHVITPLQLFGGKTRDISQVHSQDLNQTYYLSAIKGSLSRAYFVKEATSAATLEGATKILLNDSFDPRNSVLLEDKKMVMNSEINPPTQQNLSTISIIHDRSQSMIVRVFASRSGYLILNDSYYPGWKAYLDGIQTEILPANLISRAVRIPKGEHFVNFSYQPDSFKAGSKIALFSTIVALVLIFIKPLYRVFKGVSRERFFSL